MKELIQTILVTSKERISNPIVGTFLISWTAFNWKPIIYLFLSCKEIEEKIIYIDSNLASINNLLLLPLAAVLIYVLIIPYVNLLFEYLLEFSRIKRNFISITKQKQIIENKKELAIEEIKLEEAQTEFKERKNQNKLIEDLNKSIQDKEEQLLIERDRFNDLNKKIKEESNYINKRFIEDSKEFEDKMKFLKNENEILRQKIYESDRNSTERIKLLQDIQRDKDGWYKFYNEREKIRIDPLTGTQIIQ